MPSMPKTQLLQMQPGSCESRLFLRMGIGLITRFRNSRETCVCNEYNAQDFLAIFGLEAKAGILK